MKKRQDQPVREMYVGVPEYIARIVNAPWIGCINQRRQLLVSNIEDPVVAYLYLH